MKTISWKSGKKYISTWVFGLFVLGCMAPDTSLPGSDSKTDSKVEDQDLLAGASSRTTWPPDLAGDTTIQVNWQSGKELKFLFSFLDSNFQAVSFKISGTITVFNSSSIPALDSVPQMTFPLQDLDTWTFSTSSLTSLMTQGRDSLNFNVLIVSPQWGKSFLMGFKYSKSSGQFINPATSLTPENSNFLDRTERFYQGKCNAEKIVTQPTTLKNPALSFYIPGSPYYWPVNLDSLRLGPLPQGHYPLRLLRISQYSTGEPGSEVEIYEVVGLDQMQPKGFEVGKQILSMRTEITLSMRRYR